MASERRPASWPEGLTLPWVRDAIAERLLRAIDTSMSRLAGRPVSVRFEAPLGELRRGRLRAVDAELTEAEFGGLVVDHMLIRITEIDLAPGLPPSIHVPRVRVAATVSQRWVDRWLIRERLPIRVRLAEQGLATSFSLDTLGLGEIETELVVAGRWLQLRPRRAGLVQLPEFVRGVFSGYLPLPKLPAGVHLDTLQHETGELTAHFELPGFEESLTSGLTDRIRNAVFPSSD
jgi:hypothetical protein